MTQEEKDLLLKDLCARLLYGVKVQYKGNTYDLTEMHKDGRTYLGSYNSIYGDWHCSLEFENYPKPYLRPMSSMTEDEKIELKEISNDYLDEWENTKTSLERWKLDAKESYKRAVFYNSHHIDWNDLISKCLALEAPEGIYNLNFKVVEFDHFRNTKENDYDPTRTY